MTTTLSSDIIEAIVDHFGSFDADEHAEHATETDATVEEIEAAWHAYTRDLSHLPRDERQAVLSRSKPYTPAVIDGCNVRLYTDVQASKGQPRKTCAIVDLGNGRIVYAY